MESTCGNGHKKWMVCGNNRGSKCVQCDREQKRANDAARREADRQAKRDAEQAAHDAQIAALDAQIAVEQERQREHRLALEHARALAQKQQDLQDAQVRTKQQTMPIVPANTGASPPSHLPTPSGAPSLAAATQTLLSTAASFVSNRVQAMTASPSPPASSSEAEWQRQKRAEGAQNAHIDSMISMIGLEKVKQQVLDLKAEVEVTLRQGVSMTTKNLNVASLGNPGTGQSSRSSSRE
jgi:hypothetical protein